jgi:hypothetical protein
MIIESAESLFRDLGFIKSAFLYLLTSIPQ